MFQPDEIDQDCFIEACEELGVDPIETEEGDNISVDELAMEKTWNKARMKAEYEMEGDR